MTATRNYVEIKPAVRSSTAPAVPLHAKTFRIYLSSVDSKYHGIDSLGNDVALET